MSVSAKSPFDPLYFCLFAEDQQLKIDLITQFRRCHTCTEIAAEELSAAVVTTLDTKVGRLPYCDPDVLLIDHMEYLVGKIHTQTYISEILKRRTSAKKLTVLFSQCPRDLLPNLWCAAHPYNDPFAGSFIDENAEKR